MASGTIHFSNYQAITEKKRKNIQIFEFLIKSAPASKKDIAQETDINPVTVNSYIKNLSDARLVYDKGQDKSTGGRPPELFMINTREGCVLGAEIAGRHIRLICTNLKFEKIFKKEIVVDRGTDLADFKHFFVEAAKKCLAESDVSCGDIKALNISAYTSDFDLKEMADLCHNALECAVITSDPSVCAAFAEKYFNESIAGKILYINTDRGYGVIVDGPLYFSSGRIESERELKNFSGAFEEGDLPFNCEYLDYLRPWDRKRSLVSEAVAIIDKGVGTKIVEHASGSIDNITEEGIIQSAREGDDIAVELVETIGARLGLRIAFLINLFNPECVVIGGGIESAGPHVFDPVNDTVNRLSLTKCSQSVKIIPSILGKERISLGAACLAVRELFKGA